MPSGLTPALIYVGIFLLSLLGVSLAGYHAGETHAQGVYAAAALKAQQRADAQSTEWSQHYADAASQHAAEVAELKSLTPVPSVLRVYTRADLPANPPTPERATPAPGGLVCPNVLPESPASVSDFDNAKRADELAADYRELYDSWPMPPPR